MKFRFSLLALVIYTIAWTQNTEIKEYKDIYKNTIVNYIVCSVKGEENVKKPIFFFCQGSLARPLEYVTKKGTFPTFLPFDLDIIVKKYHLVVVSKPGIPIKENLKNLQEDLSYPKEGLPPAEYISNNNLEYYYQRNNALLKKLLKQTWADPKEVVAAGHSEGSYVALEMASHNNKITHLIYSGGNPLGRMMSIINENRQSAEEKENWTGESLDFWKKIVANKDKKETDKENTSFYHYTLSQNFTPTLLKIKIPVLVTYGTKDQNGIFNDYLQVLAIQNHKANYSFTSYFDCDHNFFPVKNGVADHEVDNWTMVAYDWMKWLEKK